MGMTPFPKSPNLYISFKTVLVALDQKAQKQTKLTVWILYWPFSHLRLGKEALSLGKEALSLGKEVHLLLGKEAPPFFWARSGSILGSTSA